MTAPVLTDRIHCRHCHRPIDVIWCVDGNWRFFDPDPSAGKGWWWSTKRGGMVSPDGGSFRPLVTYQVHQCQTPAPSPVHQAKGTESAQLALFPRETAS